MYCESLEKAQSQTHLSVLFFSVFLKVKSAVDQILQVPSADVVASRLRWKEGDEERGSEHSLIYLESGLNWHLRA